MSLAFVFPGQGSQSVGMLEALAEAEPLIAETFAEASRALGYDLWTLTQQGPEADLNATHKTQPAMLAAGVAVWRVWEAARGERPVALAGHSLGEFTALVCAGAIEFDAALRLVEYRGRLMQAAVPEGEGAMAAILGMDNDAVRAVCTEVAGQEIVEAVNFNAPGQVVIAGHATAVARAIDEALARGAKRAVILPVSVPSHCALMRDAAERLAAKLEEVDLKPPTITILHNVDASEHLQPGAIRDALAKQLYRPVLWVDSVEALVSRGVDRIIECGPGKVLQALVKRIDRSLQVSAIYDSRTLALNTDHVHG
ncbi:MAG: ACP S-malonyltransferase [Gammaproteobacteria bacterium]|nr:ACP S-malonyltransferase [Gammaproteobacteria bacterium]